MAVITICRQNGTVGFDPPTLNINQGDVVVFRNQDPQSQHLITRYDANTAINPNFWFQNPLAPFVAGQPADTSDEVFFPTTSSSKPPVPPLTVNYVCAQHTTETGKIIVNDPRYVAP